MAAVLIAGLAHLDAQSSRLDPLSSIFQPVIDTNPDDYPGNVWITGPLAKVLQNTGSPGNVHWAQIHAAKNEFQSFQVHVQAGAGPINNLNVTMSDLVNTRAGSRISSASTDIVVYREAYQNVTIPTATGSTFLNTTGSIPDILIPAIDPYYGQTTNAFPFNVAAGNNQSVWIDVHIPPNAPAGYYSGGVTVSSGPTVLAVMPVVYAVWDWGMPSTSSLASVTTLGYGSFCAVAYGPSAGCGSYPGAAGSSDWGVTLVNADATLQMLDNRYSMPYFNIFPGSGSFNPPPPAANFTTVYGPLLSGTHPKSILQGAKLTSAVMNLLPSQADQASFSNWVSTFAANNWAPLYWWTTDEPGLDASSWGAAIASGNQDHAFDTGCAPDPCSVPAAVTAPNQWASQFDALSSIDRLIVNLPTLETTSGFPVPLATYQSWIAEQTSPPRSFWSYLACTSAGTCSNGAVGNVANALGGTNTYPNYNVDGTPVANRVHEWITWMHGATGELYYYINICDNDAAAGCGSGAPGVTGPVTSGTQANYYSGGWGDGTLMYVGSQDYSGTAIPIWLPSIRLKMIRDGMQDYEYLQALTNSGYATFAAAQAQSFITNSYTFNNDPSALEAARQALGSRLHQLGFATRLRTTRPGTNWR